MKCPGCGAEIGDSSVCEFCGSKISANLQIEEQKAQEQLNKQGCPIPLTILMLRKKDMKPILKYGIIALAWFVYIGIGISGGESDSNETPDTSGPVYEEAIDGEAGSSAAITLMAGELGEYDKEIIMNEGTDMPENLIVYYVPAGDYTAKNVGDKMTQVSVYEGFARDESTGYDDYTSVGDTPTIEAGEIADISVPAGWFVEIHEPAISVWSRRG